MYLDATSAPGLLWQIAGMRQTIWVDGWQRQCCGKPFAIGSTVEWTIRDFDDGWLRGLLGDRAHVSVDRAEEHHDGVH